MAIMTNKELVERMYELYNQPNHYGSGGNQWSTWQKDGWWYVDCSCSIKAILWGGRFIDSNKNKSHAGCKYASNGIPDTTPEGFKKLGVCSTDFTKIEIGEIVVMEGHMGLYVGNGKVLEVTPAWTGGNPGCQLSECGSKGQRTKNGKQVYSWTHHIKLNAIEYIKDTPVYTEIEPKEIILNKNANLWDLSFTTWNGAKSIENYDKDNRFKVVATFKHSLGGLYYILESDYGKNHYGFNTVDCDDFIESQNKPTEEQKKEENSINILEDTKTSENEEIKQELDDIPTYYEEKENVLLWVIQKLIELIKELFNKKSDK